VGEKGRILEALSRGHLEVFVQVFHFRGIPGRDMGGELIDQVPEEKFFREPKFAVVLPFPDFHAGEVNEQSL
jgi:hypothetical protein